MLLERTDPEHVLPRLLLAATGIEAELGPRNGSYRHDTAFLVTILYAQRSIVCTKSRSSRLYNEHFDELVNLGPATGAAQKVHCPPVPVTDWCGHPVP